MRRIFPMNTNYAAAAAFLCIAGCAGIQGGSGIPSSEAELKSALTEPPATPIEVPQTIRFDPDGQGPRSSFVVSTFDWEAGNALVSENSRKAKHPLDEQDDFRMDLYYQTSLGAFIDSRGQAIVGTGLNENYEITMVAGFAQRGFREVSEDTIRIAHTSCKANVNFLEIYFDATPDANTLEGTGFNDGKLIYEGNVTASGVFLFPREGMESPDGRGSLPLVEAMDQFGPDDFLGVGTAVGTGRGALESKKTDQDSDFFGADVGRLLLRSQLSAPFTKVDPAKKFTVKPNGAPPESLADYGPGIALFKGGLSGIVDMQFQPDAYSTFEVVSE